MERIGILTSGGDAPGMNACIRAASRVALSQGFEVWGIYNGYAGLIRGEMEPVDRRSIANIVHLGGTVLGTARSPEFMTAEGRAHAIQNLQVRRINQLIIIGGDGTFRGGTLLKEEGKVDIVGIPTTIDNDIYGTDYSIGFDTAINTALEAIDHIRDTALSLERLFFVEVMGHHTGFIALESGIAGGAEQLIIPEVPKSIDELCQHLEISFRKGKRSAIVVVAETEQPGNSFRIAREVKDKAGFESRVCILGHIQRGGSPTARDRVLASKLGAAAVDALLNGKTGHMVGEVKGKIALTPLESTWKRKKKLNSDLIKLAERLSR